MQGADTRERGKNDFIWLRACGREMQGVDARERGKNDFIWFRVCGRERGRGKIFSEMGTFSSTLSSKGVQRPRRYNDMKKYLALLLSMLLLVGCARIEPEQGGTKPEPGQPDDVSAKLLSQYALAEVKLPELPAEPSEEELWTAYEKLDYDKMGEEAYHKAQEELWDDFDARSRAYSDAVKALRGEGVDKTMTPALLGYSTKTVSKLLGGEEAANVVYSPANLYLALSMLTETVDGETRAQLLDLLGAEDEETVRTTANAIWRSLYTDSANSKTLLANSLWLSEGQVYKTETVERLANDYYASVFSAPMGTGDTNKAVQAWLNTNTGGLLADAAKNIETKPETVMLLLSTLYFKDQWRDEFYASDTREDTFTAADGTAQRVDFMHKTEDRASYVRSEGYTVAQLSFRGGERMIFLLPDEGTALTPLLRGEAALTDLFTDVYDNDRAQTAKLVWSVPKFDVSSDLELTKAMESIGVTDVFDPDRADFSPLADFDEPAAVTQVQHAARVKIDEEGCEAAAFTAIMAEATSAMPEDLPVVEMNLNRPFAFAITGADGLPLFVGAVNTME